MRATVPAGALPAARRGRKAAAAIALSLALAASAVAPAGVVSAHAEDGVLTISQTNNDATTTYAAYQVFTADVDQSNRAANIQWAPGAQDVVSAYLSQDGKAAALDNWLASNGYTDAEKTNPRVVAGYVSEQIGQSEGVSTSGKAAGSFANDFAYYVQQNAAGLVQHTLTPGVQATLPEGYYLILNAEGTPREDTGDVATAPIWFPVGGSSSAIDVKGKPVNVTKQVREDSTGALGSTADAEVGQVVEYEVTATLPSNYGSFATYLLTIADTLPEGTTLNADSVAVEVRGADGRIDASKDTSALTVDAQDSSLTVKTDDLKAAVPGLTSSDVIAVTYSVTVNSKVKVGEANQNDVAYTFSNDPATNGTGTVGTSARLYAYVLTIDKYSTAPDAKKVAGAKFVIRNQEGKYYANNAFAADTEADAEVLITGEDGSASVTGLDEGVYTIKEVEAPEGYRIPDAETVVTITRTFDENTGSPVLTASTEHEPEATKTAAGADGSVTVSIGNEPLAELAITGGLGVGLAGAAVLAVGVGGVVASRRRAKRR